MGISKRTGSAWTFGTMMVVTMLGSVSAQGTREWIYLDTGAPSGTPPTIVLASESTPQQTVADIRIHGFWREEVWVPEAGLTFQKIDFGESRTVASHDAIGEPDLPSINLMLANATDANNGNTTLSLVVAMDIDEFAGVPLYPVQPGAVDNGDPAPPFEWDQAFYEQTTFDYPTAQVSDYLPYGSFAGLGAARLDLSPLQWNPASGRLRVMTQFRVTIDHPGQGSPRPRSLTKRQARLFETFFANYPALDPWMTELTTSYSGDFLFITPLEFWEEIQPLVEQKEERGYEVDILTTTQTGTTWQEIRAAIGAWYDGGDEESDRYVVLVGDTEFIPQCIDNFGHASDKLYVCLEGTFLDGQTDPLPEARLGRFPASDETELENMISKTLTYENGYPISGQWLDNVLLVAHEEEYPAKYTQAQEDVRLADYQVQPDFTTAYGAEGGNSNSHVQNLIEDGYGIVCYRGHGSSGSWWYWNYLLQHFNTSDVQAVDNGPKTPVMFSFSCENNRIAWNSIGEEWMAHSGGAVAHYGASDDSWTDANHTHDYETFQAIYKDDLTILSEAIMAAELETIVQHQIIGVQNVWMYFLLGDPELKVWRKAPEPLVLAWGPPELPPGPSEVRVHATDENGRSIEGVLVSIPIHGPDGTLGGAYYTDANGLASIPVDGTELRLSYGGSVPVSCFDEFGDHGVARDTIPFEVTSDAESTGGAILELSLEGASPHPIRSGTTVSYSLPRSGDVMLKVVDAQGRQVVTLVEGHRNAGRHTLDWEGADANGRRLGSGVYFSILTLGKETRRTRLVIAR